MDLVDTHVHVVASDRVRYPLDRVEHPGHEWVDEAPDAVAFAGRMDPAGVAAAVLVQPHGAYRYDNRYCVDAAQANSRLASVAIVDPMDPAIADRTAELAKSGAAGIRLFSVPTPAVGWLGAEPGARLLEAAATHGLTATVCVLPAEIETVVAVAATRPSQPLVIDHCGFVLPGDGSGGEAMRRLAARPNVHLKVTTHVIDAWLGSGRPVDELFPTLHEMVGAGRLVWGSDYAQTHDRSYDELVALGRRALAALGDAADEPAATARRLWCPDAG